MGVGIISVHHHFQPKLNSLFSHISVIGMTLALVGVLCKAPSVSVNVKSVVLFPNILLKFGLSFFSGLFSHGCWVEVRILGLPCGLVMLDCEEDNKGVHRLFVKVRFVYKNTYI